ncbi:hypothetical protein BJ165DRAFT_1534117 [Panaeolus papilionaceus]|nr:hypothetical protein BJ165DRAFT_1534117 [Panaeolus papilionaceus]
MSDVDSRPHQELHTSLKAIISLYQKEDERASMCRRFSVVGHYINNLSTLFLELDELVQVRGKFDGTSVYMHSLALQCTELFQVLSMALSGSNIGLNVAMRFRQYLQLHHRDPHAPFNDPRSPRVSKVSPPRSPAAFPSIESSRKSVDCDSEIKADGEVGEQ